MVRSVFGRAGKACPMQLWESLLYLIIIAVELEVIVD